MLEFFFDLIFPKRCVGCGKFGSYLCDKCFSGIQIYEEFVCPVCLKRSITGQTHPGCISSYALDGLISGVVYKGVVRRLLFSLKFKPYVFDLKKTAANLFIETIRQNELFERVLSSQPIPLPSDRREQGGGKEATNETKWNSEHLIVAVVPLSYQKLKKRGYNQAEIFSEAIFQEFNLKYFPKIIIRSKSTKPQFKLDKKHRFENVLGVFELDYRFKDKIRGSTMLIVDDLATSCATLRECAKVLKRNGAKRVFGVTFAREI